MDVLYSDPLITSELARSLTTALVLFAITIPIAQRIAVLDGDDRTTRIVLGGLVAHFVGSIAQVWVVRLIYQNSADFHLYLGDGARISADWHQWVGAWTDRDIPGTGGAIILAAVVMFVVGADQLSTFFVFTWFSFLGLLAFYRAFRLSLPAVRPRRLLVLLMFLPSLWYWPTVAGKEAPMVLSLGLILLGAVHLWQRTSLVPAVAMVLLGGLIGVLVRPHEVILLIGAIVAALMVQRWAPDTKRWLRLLVIVLALAVSAALVVIAAPMLGIESYSPQGFADAIANANEATQGEGTGFGSSHSSWNGSPLYFPYDVYLVLFKPLPFEVASAGQAIAAAENLLIMGLLVTSLKRLWASVLMVRTNPLIATAWVYLIGFIYLFSSLGNVGLLVRERTLMLPMLLFLVCVEARQDPRRSPRARSRRSDLYRRAGAGVG